MAPINYFILQYSFNIRLALEVRVEQIHLFQAVTLHNMLIEVTDKKNKLVFEG